MNKKFYSICVMLLLTHDIPLKSLIGFALTGYLVAKLEAVEGCVGWGFGGDSLYVCLRPKGSGK